MKLNTTTEVEMMDGSKLKCTLTFRALLSLSSEDKKAYTEYNKVMGKQERTEIDSIRILYTAYLCGLAIDGKPLKKALSFDEFIDGIVPDRIMLGQAITSLMNPKKAMDSAKHSSFAE